MTPGETRLYRIINAGTLMYQTVCFEEHAVTVVAADAYPTKHVHTECVDINAGQRCAVDAARHSHWWRVPNRVNDLHPIVICATGIVDMQQSVQQQGVG